MFHFARGVALRVDVAYLFELERALHSKRVILAPAQKQEVGAAGVLARQQFVLRLVCGERAYHIRQPRKLARYARHPLAVKNAALDAHMRGEQVERRQRADECLCGGDADFQARANLQRVIRHARGLRAIIVAQRNLAYPAPLSLIHRGERIGGLARLRYGHHKRAVVHHGVAVSKLGRIVHLSRYARQRFHPHPAQHPRMQACPHSQENNPVETPELIVRETEIGQADFKRVKVNAPAQRVNDDFGLLVNFFEHKVLVFALGGGQRVVWQV